MTAQTAKRETRETKATREIKAKKEIKATRAMPVRTAAAPDIFMQKQEFREYFSITAAQL